MSSRYLWVLTLSTHVQQFLRRRGDLGVVGCFFLDNHHVLAIGSIEFQVITISPSTKFVDITLQMMIVTKTENQVGLDR